MSSFLNGPAAGRTLSIRRAPYLLRVVIDRTTGAVDALDQLDDDPSDTEDVYVYRLAAPPQQAHVCYGGRQRHRSGWFEFGIYQHVPEADGAALRETAAWRAWAAEQHAADAAKE